MSPRPQREGDMSESNTPTLEEFEAVVSHSTAHQGFYAQFLLGLEASVPTSCDKKGATIYNRGQMLRQQWTGVAGKLAVRPVKGGAIKTRIIDGTLYVVWYPEEKS